MDPQPGGVRLVAAVASDKKQPKWRAELNEEELHGLQKYYIV